MTTETELQLQRALGAMRVLRKRMEELEAARREPIAIIGMACRFPGMAADLSGYWSLLERGESAMVELSRRFSPEALVGVPPRAGLLETIADFDPLVFGMTPREAAALDPQQRLMLEVCWEALEHAGYAPTRVTEQPVGVFVGLTAVDFRELYELEPAVLDAHAATGAANCFAAGRIAYTLGLEGAAMVIDTACSSSLVAVHLACQSLRSGESRMALAGGANVILSPLAMQLVATTGALAPDGECRAFDARASGFSRGEGAGVVVLKRLRDALEAGDPICAVIRGSAVNQDGRSMNLTAPNGEAQARLIRRALEDAGVDAADVTYVEAHGTGTQLGDPIELESLNDVVGRGSKRCYVGSVKASIGHLEAAAGVAGLIKVVLAMQHGRVPRQANFERLNSHIALDGSRLGIPTETLDWEDARKLAGVSSFGMSGTNAHVVLEQAPARPRQANAPGRPFHLLTLSARTGEAVAALATRYRLDLLARDASDVADFCHTANSARAQWRTRAAVVADSHAALMDRLECVASGTSAGGVFVRSEGDCAAAGIAFLFTGQGSAYDGMGRDLYDSEPEFRRVLDQCADLLRPELDRPLASVLFPKPGEPSLLDQTLYAQPALFALEYALARFWISLGLRPTALLGHSVGEYVAACVAGALSLEDALPLVARRGALMQATEPGTMVALFTSREVVEDALAAFSSELSIAAVNGPNSVVVSGRSQAAAAVCEALSPRGVRHKSLGVSRAFHSPLMDPILDALEREAQRVTYRSTGIPWISNSSGRALLEGTRVDAGYFRTHTRAPVLFATGVQSLLEAGCSTFLEVGPTATLVGLVRQNLGASAPARLLASLTKGKNGVESVLSALAALYVDGQDVDLAAMDRGLGRRRVTLPSYPFQRRRYWSVPTLSNRRAGTPIQSALHELDAADGGATSAPPSDAPHAPLEEADLGRTLAAANREEREVLVRSIVLATLGDVMRVAVSELDPNDSLRVLGLDSLLAVELRQALHRKLGVRLDLVTLLETSSLRELATELLEVLETSGPGAPGDAASEGETRASLAPPVVLRPQERHSPFPLTELQQAYLVGRTSAFALGGTSTHFLLEFDLHDADVDRVIQAFQELVRRHDMLRAVVASSGEQRVLQNVGDCPVTVLDLSEADPVARDRRLAAIREEMSEQMFDTERWPLFDVRATRTGARTYRLHLGFDALIVDAWSLSLLFREWSALYRAPGTPLEPLELTYRDALLAQLEREDSLEYARALAYWRARLATLPPPPDLPLAKNPEKLRSPVFRRRTTRLSADCFRHFKREAVARGVTASAAVCSVYAEVLATFSRSPKFTLNLLVLNRAPVHAQVLSVVGNFSTTLLLEIDASPALPFVERARHLQHQLFSDLEHQAVSGVRVLRELNRDRGSAASVNMPVVFASTLNFGAQEAAANFRLDLGASAEPVHASLRTPQVWLDHQVIEDDGELVLNWDAVEDLFLPGMLDDMFAMYAARLEQLGRDAAAWDALSTLPLPPAHLELRARVNATAAPLREDLLHAPFLECARRDPNAVALIGPGRRVTYGTLDELSDRAAGWLSAHGVQRGSLVAVVMVKGPEQVIGALAVLKTGAAYVPIDPSLPAERLEYLLAHSRAACVLTQSEVDVRVPWPSGLPKLDVDTANGLPRPTRIACPARPADLAYVIYTSGSTGLPKGVMIEHRAALNTVLDVNERLNVTAPDRIFALSSFSFDLSVYDVFGMLAAGAAIVFPRPEDGREPGRWLEQLAAERVTLWNTVPALMEMLVDHLSVTGAADTLSLREILLSGDSIPVSLPGRIKKFAPRAKCLSLGGATEASIWSILYPIEKVDPSWTSIPYGKPMKNQRFDVLDARLEPRPIGVPGELYILGDGLARGYFGDETKTRASFLVHPRTGERLYKTGDLGRYLPDGNIEFLGREDFQVKISGYRVELGEVEVALGKLPYVRAAVAVAVGERGAKRLVAYVVPEEDAVLSEDGMREALAQRLPAYAVPSRIVVLGALPLTPNGKVDRKALPEPGAVPSTGVRAQPDTPTERALAPLFRELVKHEDFGIDDGFFAIGGQSLLAVRLMGRVKQRFGVSLPLSTLFECPTIRALARRIDECAEGARRTPLVAVRATGRDRPWFFVHPVGGDVLCYAELARALGEDLPFYALQTPDGDDRPSSVEAMAELYAAELRRVEPRGPYRLGGWSMGGVVAYEMARRLRLSGQSVELLALIDVTMPPFGARAPVDEAWLIGAFVRDLAGLAQSDLLLDTTALEESDEGARFTAVLDLARRQRILPEHADSSALRGYFERFKTNYRAMLGYWPGACELPLLFFRAERDGASEATGRAWNELASFGELLELEGNHYGITNPRIARLIASTLRARTTLDRGSMAAQPGTRRRRSRPMASDAPFEAPSKLGD